MCSSRSRPENRSPTRCGCETLRALPPGSCRSGFNKRRASAYRLAAQLIAEPEFGELTSVELTYSSFPVPGLRLHLTDMSIHALDMVRWLAGEPVRIACYKRARGDNHVLALTVEHESGVVSRLELSALAPGIRERAGGHRRGRGRGGRRRGAC